MDLDLLVRNHALAEAAAGATTKTKSKIKRERKKEQIEKNVIFILDWVFRMPNDSSAKLFNRTIHQMQTTKNMP